MKIGNLYNLSSIDAFAASGNQQGFQDSLAGVVLARNLTAIDPKLFEKKFPELALLNCGLDVDNSGGYARMIQSLRVQDSGDFKLASDVVGDKGKISLQAETSIIRVYSYEGHSIWSDDEVKEAELQNINLPSQFLASHNRLYQRKIDEIGLIGSVSAQKGLLNTTDFTSGSAAGAAAALTAIQLYQEIADLITTQRNAVNNTPEYKCNVVLMPVRVMNECQSKLLDNADSVKNVLQALQQNFPDVKFVASHRADTTANGGNLGTSATVAFSNSADSMKLRIPVPLTVGEIIKPSSFNFRVDSKFRIGGLDILEKTSGYILTGL